MFQDLTEKLEGIFKRLKGHGKLTEKNIDASLKEIRRALLEADVNYKVAKQFITDVKEKALGEQVLRSITPGQQIVKIIFDELVELLGESDVPLKTASIPPTVIMLVGLQGSGKTTFAGKLAKYLKKQGHNPVLVAADVRRPAAIEQLKIIGESVDTPVVVENTKDAVKNCSASISYCRKNGFDTAILDTGGRLHIDHELMQELLQIKASTTPNEILFIADGMTGQDAVNTAKEFVAQLEFTGFVLTKMDGDTRGGAAISIRAVTGTPIKFIGVGEKMDAIEKFHPDRMASRILGMGDVVSLVEKAQDLVDQKAAEKLEKRLRRQQFSLSDFYEQLQQIKKMGPLDHLLSMIPGMSGKALKNFQADDKSIVKVEAIINSMTPDERERPGIINGSRRRRIAGGSGTSVQDVNQLLKQFTMMQKMIKNMNRFKFKGMPFQF
ncbi:signal recognition particle protein [candidate division KSB1 bacterium]|nr:signal recognition particle protein [candidate division KSB1 bacterium]